MNEGFIDLKAPAPSRWDRSDTLRSIFATRMPRSMILDWDRSGRLPPIRAKPSPLTISAACVANSVRALPVDGRKSPAVKRVARKDPP
jgi:hypothetical protein